MTLLTVKWIGRHRAVVRFPATEAEEFEMRAVRAAQGREIASTWQRFFKTGAIGPGKVWGPEELQKMGSFVEEQREISRDSTAVAIEKDPDEWELLHKKYIALREGEALDADSGEVFQISEEEADQDRLPE